MMESLYVVCPSGQFSAPAHCDAQAYCLQDAICNSGQQQQQQQHQTGSLLLEQLQDCNTRAQRLLNLLSIHREQGIAAHAAQVAALFAEALTCIVKALQTAAAAKQPLLTTSSQHSSSFCKLLERLHLLDALWKASNPGPTPGMHANEAAEDCGEIEAAAAQEAVQCPALPFISQMESKLRGTSRLDAVLAALIAHAQQNAASGGSKLGPGALNPAAGKPDVQEVLALSAVQEQHSSARALPLLIRLYFNTGSRTETIAAGRPEPLTAKLLERSLSVLAAKPVVPGCADVPVCLTSGLQACQGLPELAAARKLKLPTELGKLDFKAAFKLDQSYSLQDKVLPLLQQHDELCDLLSQLALEIQQAVAVERDVDPKALDNAEQLVAGSINFVAAAKNSLLDLDAWRLSTCGAATDSATPTSAAAYPEQSLDGFHTGSSDIESSCDRYKLKDDDVVPFMDVLGAIKGLTGLLADSSSWLQPVLQEHAVKQLNEFAFFTLPALSKLYARNPRLQDLLRAIYACMQGQYVEVGEDVDAAAVPCSAAAEATLLAGASESQLLQQAGRPLGEGFESLKERWGKKGAARKHTSTPVVNATAVGVVEREEAESEQQVQAAEPADAAAANDAATAAVVATAAAAAAADVEAATTAAAAAAAAALSASSSPRSVSQVEVDAVEQPPSAEQQEASAEQQQEDGTERPAGSVVADSVGDAAEGAPVEDSSQQLPVSAPQPALLEPAEEQPIAATATTAEVQAAAATAAASRKRTIKGFFKFKTASSRKKDKAAALTSAELPAVVLPQAADGTASPSTAAAPAPSSMVAADASTPGAERQAQQTTLVEDPQQTETRQEQEQQQEQQVPGQRARLPEQPQQQQQQPPCSSFAWVDSENDMLLCSMKPIEAGIPASGASSMTDLNSAGFERPPDLPWELQSTVTDDSPRSVARAAAMFERIAAINRQLAAASGPRLSSAGRAAAGASRSSPGCWESSAGSGFGPASRLTEAGGSSPLSREQLRQAAQDAEQRDRERGIPFADSAAVQQHDGGGATSPVQAKRRQGLFGFRSLKPQRSAAEAQQALPPPTASSGQEAADGAAEHKQLAALQQEKEQLQQQLHGKQEQALLPGQEMDDGMQAALAGDAAIPAAWDSTAPSSPDSKDSKHRMKGMLSMLRRGSARTAAGAAAAVLQADKAPADALAEQQLGVAELAVAAVDGMYGQDSAIEAELAGSQCGSQPDASEDFDEDQPSKTRRVMGLMNRIRVFTQGANKEQQAQQAAQQQHTQQQHTPPVGDAVGNRQGLRGLKFTAKLKKAMSERRQSRFADAVGVDGQTQLPLEAMPSAACLQLLRVLLELLMQEIKTETKKHLMMQLQMAAAAAAGNAGVSKPDASLARPLKMVKQMVKAVHTMQLMVDFPKQLLVAADLSDLWVGASCGHSLATVVLAAQQPAAGPGGDTWQMPGSSHSKQQQGLDAQKASVDLSPPSPKGLHPWSLYNLLFEENSEASLSEAVRNSLGAWSQSKGAQQGAAGTPRSMAAAADDRHLSRSSSPAALPHLSSFPSALISACMQQLERMPAELPLLALQTLWDARRLLKGCGLLGQGLPLLQQQEQLCMVCYMQHLVPTAYEHFKRLAGHQTLTTELLQSCKAGPLQPVKALYVDSMLREPCKLVMQGNYAAIAAEAASALQPGHLTAADMQLADTLQNLADVQQELQQRRAVDQVQRAVQGLQQAEQEQQLAAETQTVTMQEQPVLDQQDSEALRFSGVFTAAKPFPGKAAAASEPAAGANLGRAGRKKRQGRATKPRTSAAGSAANPVQASAGSPGKHTGEQPAGVTPLMQKLEGMQAVQDAEAAAHRYTAHCCLQAWDACELDVRQWLVAGMLEALQQDAAAVVARCSADRPTSLVECQVHAAVLQRTHILLTQHMALPLTWDQIWQQAETQGAEEARQQHACESRTVSAAVAGLLQMLETAVYDGEAQVLLPVFAPDASAAVPGVHGVLREVEAALQPLAAFFGRQHLAALHALMGPLGVQQLITGVLGKLENEQSTLLEELLSLQQQLPQSLLQLPPAEQCHSAGAVLQFYQQQLSGALQDHSRCSAALACLQRIGNCLALLHLLSLQQAAQATPTFMQVAPLLGIVGRPMTDAAAAAECFEGEDLPAPPSVLAAAAAAASGCHNLPKACTPGLLMPEIETLVPSDHARHTYEMQALKELHQEDVLRWEAQQAGQTGADSLVKPGSDLARHRVWQASHFQRLLLGPDAEKVRGPAMLLTHAAELRAWRATEGVDVLGPCLEKLQDWAVQLQSQLQGEKVVRRRSKGARAAGGPRECAPAERAEGSAKASKRRVPRSRQSEQLSRQQQVLHSLVGGDAAAVGDVRPEQIAAAVLSASAEVAAATVRALSAEPSADSYGALTEQATDGDLTEVEQQLQALQAQVNAALIAAEERLRVVSMSPPQALLNEARPRLQLPPQPIPFSLTAAVPAATATNEAAAAMESSSADAAGVHPADALEAEDSVQQASPRTGTFNGASAAPCSEGSTRAGSSSTSTAAGVPAAFLNNYQELAAAAAADGDAAAGLSCNPWEAADSAAAQLPPGSVPPAQAKLAYKLLTQSTVTSLQEAAFDAPESEGSASSKAVSSAPLPAGQNCAAAGIGASGGSDTVCKHADDDDNAQPGGSSASNPASSPGSTSQHSLAKRVSCPGCCEGSEDGGSEHRQSEKGSDLASPRSTHSQLPSPRRSPSPQMSRSRTTHLVDAEGSLLMTAAAAFRAPSSDGEQPSSADGEEDSEEDGNDPMRFAATPPITDLLYETTCDELVRVKDERDMLKSEVEVLRNQLQNRDNTLAMLSGQMLVTPRTSTAECESLMRAAMSDCSVGSMAMRSQPAVSGVPSLPSNTVSLGNSANGTLAMRRAASATLGSAEASSEAVALQGRAAGAPAGQQQQRQARQLQGRGRAKSAPRAAEARGDGRSAAVSTEPSEVRGDHSKSSVRAQQTTPCTDVSIIDDDNSGAEQGACTRGAGSERGRTRNRSSDSSCFDNNDENDDGSSSSNSSSDGCYSDGSSDGLEEEELLGLDEVESCLISTASCGASRKLKMPRAVKASRRSRSSSSNHSSPWPPAQLALALSALKFVLLLEVATGADGAGGQGGPSPDDAQGGAAGAPAQSSPLKRFKRAVEGVAAEAAAVAAGVMHGNEAAAQQQQSAGAARVATGPHAAAAAAVHTMGSSRMTTMQYGDGPLLASSVLLQLSGQARRFEMVDATSRITYWVEYDAVKAAASSSSGNSSNGAAAAEGGAAASSPRDAAAAAAAAGAAGSNVLSPRGTNAAGGNAPSGSVAAIVGAPGGIGPAAEGVAPPKPRSKKRQEEEAEALARDRAAAAAQQQLLERLAAVHRQAARVSKDGSSLAARFAPAAPARHQRVRLRVYRVDHAAVQQMRAAAMVSGAGSCSPGRITFGGGLPGAPAPNTNSGGGSAEQPKVPAVPVKAATLQFWPRKQPWAGMRPMQRPIHPHPSLPMPRPQPLLLGNGGPGGAARGGGVADAAFVPAAVAGLPPEAAAAAAAAAAAGTGIVGPSGRLLTSAIVAPRAGLVAAARVMAAREVLLQVVPRNAAYSFSVVSDQNRSGRPEDGYSMAPSSADLDSLASESPRRSPHRQGLMSAGLMSAAVGASAARLGGRQRATGAAADAATTPPGLEQWLAGGSGAAGALSGGEASPSRQLSKSPTKRLARAFAGS